MPEMRLIIRWPDGRRESCYSPSLAVKDFLTPGQTYPLSGFLERSRAALGIASDRVKAIYGRPCSRAVAQLDRIEMAAAAFAGQPDVQVAVEAFEE
jgi:uncharacterized repeat protein (TIGR04042 family)